MPLTIPNPSNVKIAFDTRADFIAAYIPNSINYVMADGLLYKRDSTGTAAETADGDKWSPGDWEVTPMHFGAVADGTTDDVAALNALTTYVEAAAYDPTGFVEQPIVIDFKGRICAVGSTWTTPATPWTYTLKNGALVAVSGGSGFNNGTYNAYSGSFADGYTGWLDFLIDHTASYCNIQNFNLYCQDISNGIRSAGGRTRFRGCTIRRMKDVGIWQPTGGDQRIESCLIQQLNLTASGDPDATVPSNFTAVGVLAEQSDCKIINTTISWCKKNWVGTGGVQLLYNNHFFSGVNGTPLTGAVLIEWKPDSLSGSLDINSCYLDNGYVDLYQDKVAIKGCVSLLDNADVTQDSQIRVYCHLAGQDTSLPRVIISDHTFFEYDGAVKLIEILDEDYSWDANASDLADFLNEIVSSGDTLVDQPSLLRQQFWSVTSDNDWVHRYKSANSKAMTQWSDSTTTGNGISFGSAGDDAWIRTPDGSLVIGSGYANPKMEVNEGVVTLEAKSSEPTASNYSIAMSDGTSSTNGFGTSGAGLYIRLSGSWTKL